MKQNKINCFYKEQQLVKAVSESPSKSIQAISPKLMKQCKQSGFSDKHIARLIMSEELTVRAVRKSYKVKQNKAKKKI